MRWGVPLTPELHYLVRQAHLHAMTMQVSLARDVQENLVVSTLEPLVPERYRFWKRSSLRLYIVLLMWVNRVTYMQRLSLCPVRLLRATCCNR